MRSIPRSGVTYSTEQNYLNVVPHTYVGGADWLDHTSIAVDSPPCVRWFEESDFVRNQSRLTTRVSENGMDGPLAGSIVVGDTLGDLREGDGVGCRLDFNLDALADLRVGNDDNVPAVDPRDAVTLVSQTLDLDTPAVAG